MRIVRSCAGSDADLFAGDQRERNYSSSCTFCGGALDRRKGGDDRDAGRQCRGLFLSRPKKGSTRRSSCGRMWLELRDAYRTMATQLAGEGYAVLAVNHYYRSTKMPLFETFDGWRSEEGKAKVKPMREALTTEAIAKDGAAFIAWLDKQTEVDAAKKVATTGYCMGGPFTVRTAAAVSGSCWRDCVVPRRRTGDRRA